MHPQRVCGRNACAGSRHRGAHAGGYGNRGAGRPWHGQDGICRRSGRRPGRVGYQGRLPFCHIDAYRLEGLTEEEISLTGIADCFRREKTAFVEWPDFIAAFLPPDTIWLRILPGDAPELRLLTFSYSDQTGGWLDAAFGD